MIASRLIFLKSKVFNTLEQFMPYLTEFDDTECNLCAPNDQLKLRRRNCVWFEGSNKEACVEVRSSNDSQRCWNESLSVPCPTNGKQVSKLKE